MNHFFLLGILLVATPTLPAHSQEKLPLQVQPLTSDQLTAELGGPTLLTLHFHNAKPREVFDEIARQTRQPIRLSETPGDYWNNKRFFVDVDQKPFLQVMETLARQVGFLWNKDTSRDGIEIYATNGFPAELGAPNVDLGVVRVAALGALRDRWVGNAFGDVTKTVVENGDTLRVRFAVVSDPKLSILENGAQFQPVSATTEDDAKLFFARREEFTDGALGYFSTAIWQLESDLRLYASSDRKKLDYRGQLSLTAVTQKEIWRIEDVLNRSELSRDFLTSYGLLRVTLHEIQLETEGAHVGNYQSRVEAQIIGGNDTQAEQAFLLKIKTYLSQKSRLYDRNGVFLRANGLGIGGAGGDTISWNRVKWSDHRDDADEPHLFTIEVPLQTREVALPFEFLDLPIPQFTDAGYAIK